MSSVPYPKVISIVGPTASGKTGLGIVLAQRLIALGQPAEIINADAYQMYRHMNVGTAKASEEERATIPHHLLDIIEPDETMSAARFQKLARALISQLQGRGVRPILVGGSGLYARAALDDISFQGTDAEVRAHLEQRERNEGAGVLFAELEAKDPQAAKRMDPRNSRRTIRALEVIELTGKPYSASLPRYSYIIPALQIGLDVSREILDERIDRRTEKMREHGLVAEVESLRNKLSVTAERALGYEQILCYLDGKMSEDEAFAVIAQKTKRLARKQMGWFGRDPRIHWFNAMSPTLADDVMKLIAKIDSTNIDEPVEQNNEPIVHHLGQVNSKG